MSQVILWFAISWRALKSANLLRHMVLIRKRASDQISQVERHWTASLDGFVSHIHSLTHSLVTYWITNHSIRHSLSANSGWVCYHPLKSGSLSDELECISNKHEFFSFLVINSSAISYQLSAFKSTRYQQRAV